MLGALFAAVFGVLCCAVLCCPGQRCSNAVRCPASSLEPPSSLLPRSSRSIPAGWPSHPTCGCGW